jgi:rare lipoprotein A
MALVTVAAASLAACASVQPQSPPTPPLASAAGTAPQRVGAPYQVNGIWYVPREQPDYDAVGTASWYGDAFDGRPTADGEIFDMNSPSAAHTTLPLPCIVEVTNLENGRKMRLRVNDRGPFVGDRIIDLSHEAARELGYERQGLARVRVRYIGPAPLLGPEAGVRIARARTPQSRGVEYASAAPTKPIPYAQLARAPRAAPAPAPRGPASDSDVVFTGAPAPARARQLQIITAMPERGLQRAAVGGLYRIQAGAFSDPVRAQRVAQRLGSLGPAAVEPLQRNGATLYRVVLTGPSDSVAAYDLRDRVAEAGFADARVIAP